LRADAAPRARLPFGQAITVRRRHEQLRPARHLRATMIGPLRPRRMVVDVADRSEVTRAAIRAALDGAVGGQPSLDGPGQGLTQEARAAAGAKVPPRQHLTERTAPQVERGVEPVRREGVLPALEPAAVGPAVEAGTGPLRGFDDVSEPAVTAREHAFEPRQLA